MEYWDIYDKDGNFTGKIIEKGTAFLPGEYHKAVEIWIINKDGNLLLQKRERCGGTVSRPLGTDNRTAEIRRNTS